MAASLGVSLFAMAKLAAPISVMVVWILLVCSCSSKDILYKQLCMN